MKYIWLCLTLTWAIALQAQNNTPDSPPSDLPSDLPNDVPSDLSSDLLGDLLGESLSDSEAEKSAKPSGTPLEIPPDIPLEIHGKHRLSLMLPFSSALDSRATQPALRNRVQFRFDPGGGLALSGGVQLNSFLQENSEIELDHELLLDETYLQLYSLQGLWSIYFGWQKISWGAADKISPIDVLNPKDLRFMPRDQEKQAALGLRFQLQPAPWFSLEGLYIPFYRENLLGLDFEELILAGLGPLNTGTKLKLADDELNFRHPSLGARLHFYLPNFDLGASYIFKPDPALSPKLSLRQNNNNFYNISQIELERGQLHYFGLDMRAAFDGWNLWLDSTFILSSDWQAGSFQTRSPQWDNVLGLDILFGPEQKFYANFQYRLRWLPDFRQELGYKTAGPLPFELGRSKSYYENFYLYQMNDMLAGFDSALEQGIFVSLELPFAISGSGVSKNPKAPQLEELKFSVNMGYQLPLIYQAEATRLGQIYLNPEFKLTWNIPAQRSTKFGLGTSLSMSLAMGLEWSSYLEGDGEKPQNISGIGRYEEQSQIYLELELLW